MYERSMYIMGQHKWPKMATSVKKLSWLAGNN